MSSRLFVLVSVCLALGCGAEAGAEATDEESLGGGPGAIGVAQNHLTRGGRAWVPKGFSMIGALTAPATIPAQKHWGAPELRAAKSWGADALRLQVSQPALDPSDRLHEPHYVHRLEAMVALAKKHGFAVILSMQDQHLSGGDSEPQPTDATLRAWRTLAPVFAGDRSVVYELFNEPHNDDDAAGWAKWKDGAGTAVGHQRVLDLVRSLGAKNVVLADGAAWAQSLRGVPELSDPLGRVGYAVHPYFVDSIDHDPKAWDERFGDVSAHHPVVATEWNDTTWFQPGGCEPDAARRAPELVAYLGRHRIGVFGWAFDIPGTLVKDWTWEPTTLDGFTCGPHRPHDGAGALLKRAFSEK
jgi:hypothetical protein